MRNLKKILALVLALMMTLSLMVTASAVKFEDSKDSAYATAIDVMSGIGVIDGMEGGFNPKGTLTREQAAKIITYMVLGPEVAATLGTPTAPFKDVPAGKWSAGSVAYCANAGIVNGRGDGTFDPTGLVTGNEFGKMLLVAIGAGDGARYSGSGYPINVAIDAKNNKVLDGLNLNLNAPLTREQACQMAFNGLTKYSPNGTTYTVNGVEFSNINDAAIYAAVVGNGAKPVPTTKGTMAETVFGLALVTGNVTSNDAVVATKTGTTAIDGTTTVSAATGLNVLGHNVTVYYQDADKNNACGPTEKVYSVVDNTTEVAVNLAWDAAQLKSALNAVGVTADLTANSVNKIADGVVTTSGTTNNAITLGTTAGSAVGADYILVAGGTIVGVKNADTYQVSKVTAYRAPTATVDGSITITNVTTAGIYGSAAPVKLPKIGDTTTACNVSLYDGVKEGDFVYLQKVGSAPMNVTKAAMIEGLAVTSVTGSTSCVIGGNTYSLSSVTSNSVVTAVDRTLVGTNLYSYVLDKDGAVVGYTSYSGAPSAANSYAKVLDIAYVDGEAASITNGYQATYAKATAYLLLSNGTKAAFTYTSSTRVEGDADTNSLKADFNSIDNGDIIKYAASNGVFTEIPTKYTETATNAVINAGSPVSGATNVYYTATTPFVYMDTANVANTATLITGYAGTKDNGETTNSNVDVVVEGNNVVVVFVNKDHSAAPTTATNIAYLADTLTSGSGYATVKYDEALKTNVYGYEIYVDGVKTTLWAKSSTMAATAGFVTYTLSDGYLSEVSNTLTGYTTVSGTVSFVDASSIVLTASDTSTPYVNNPAAKIITKSTANGISAGGTVAVGATVTALKNNSTGALDYIVIETA